MILTKSFVKRKSSKSTAVYENAGVIISEMNQRIMKADSADKYDIFLSHSYRDKETVLGLVEMLNKCNYTVYVDWIDDKQLDRSSVDTKTADLLRKRMSQCKCLMFLTSSNSTDSKWCPWELGYYDGYSKNRRCCIMPVLEYSADSFAGQEYLGLYPYIDYETSKGTGKYEFWVNSQKKSGEYVRLRDWINGKEPHAH